MPNTEYPHYHPLIKRDVSKTFRENISHLDIDLQFQYWAFGTLPVVRTIPTNGSKCDVLEWLDTPRR